MVATTLLCDEADVEGRGTDETVLATFALPLATRPRTAAEVAGREGIPVGSLVLAVVALVMMVVVRAVEGIAKGILLEV